MTDRVIAPWLQAALAGAGVIAIAESVIRLHRSLVIGRVLETPTLTASHALSLADRRAQAIEVADGWWLVLTAVLYMVWTGFAYRDLARAGGRHRMPIWLAVVAPFVPVGSLALMPAAMGDLTRQSRHPRTPRVGWWFVTWVVAIVVRFTIGGATDGGTLAEAQRGDRIIAVSAVPYAVSAVLLTGLIGVVTARAAGRRAGAAAVAAGDDLPADPETTDGALGWYRDPNRQAEVRWWDGSAWTHHVASSRQAPAPVVRGRPGSAPRNRQW